MSLEGTRIFLVEDETIIAMTAEDMLEALGCLVVASAVTLDQALAEVETTRFDVALLDLNLHGKDSLPVAARLRELERPFIFTTGYGPSGAGTDYQDVPLVTKPYRISDLAAAIHRALGR